MQCRAARFESAADSWLVAADSIQAFLQPDAIQGADRETGKDFYPALELFERFAERQPLLRVSAFEGTELVYYLNPQQSLRASYYRNLMAHHFLGRAVLELALQGLDPTRPVNEAELLASVAALRDLLKFEYFFPEKEAFVDSITADLRRSAPRWQGSKPATVLAKLHPPTLGWVIRPSLQSYLVVADELLARPDAIGDEKAFITACLKRGEQYRLQGIIGADGVSAVVFKQALALARNRELVESPAGRADFAAEIRSALGASDRPPKAPRGGQKEHQGVGG